MNIKFKGLAIDLCWLVLIIVIGFLIVSMMGCASSKPIETPDRVDTETVTTPMPCIYDIELLEPLILPGWPVFPGEEGGEVEIKKWLADLKTIDGKREALLWGRVTAYELKIQTHNDQRPKCS